MTDSAILDAFFEECEDLLVALSDGLEDMREGKADSETVNAVFRSVHSIKGAAGAFSLEDLVSFAHIFETVLDDVRAGKLATDDTLLRVLQRAGDILADLVDAARDGLPADADQVDPVVAELQSFLGAEGLVEEEFVFEALTLAFDNAPTTATYQVQFRPSREFYATGNDPALVIAALQDLGPCTVRTLTGDVPHDFADFQWDEGYLTWQVDVADQQNDLAIREVFQFVDDLCDLRIAEDFGDEAAPLADDPAPDVALSTETAGPPYETAQEPVVERVVQPAVMEDAPAKTDKPAKRPASTLRVDPERVDRLINAVGELIINQSVISQRIDEAGLPNSAELHGDLDDYKLLAREIQEGVMAIRAQPVKPLFQRMLRIAREAADATGKDVNLVTEGDGTEVDKIVVERLADPLTHMIRNAIDHGIEKPHDRVSAGKPATGTLRLTASQRSGSIVIEIIDDGAGLNRKRIKEIAISKGLISADLQLTEQEIDHLLFAPGFSTAAEVTNLSGRGVGMDVVKTAITALGGRITISSITGQGTTFSITLPLTLAVMDGMIINVGGQTMVVPISSILETIRPTKADLSRIGLHSQLLRIRGDYVPIIDLAERLGVRSSSDTMTDRVLLLIQTESVTQCALAVDDIFDQRQVVVKSMQGSYGEIAGISGATILGDGKIALIIDPDAIAAAPTTELKLQIQAQREVAHAAT
ncbi:two-component system, chemotaxis family, sensor kinase CheA [Yoonia rosea]|uniref:Chemotaxis protein CheA n=1 Tax=Yoonia rosea TaxID=287098 RepID=A0A1R3WX98_9RHOB|nr:chemotaxis protein CheA [Yoonia rosea]SIT82324.1 two-component system, chemotaxis family, sensor kinase CheA [Yoonia rosea]